MKVNLIKDTSISKEVFTEVFDLLISVPGPIKFCIDNDSLVDFNEDEYFERNIQDRIEFETIKISPNSIFQCPQCGGSIDIVQVSNENGKDYGKCLTCGIKIDLKEFIEYKNTVTWETLFGKCNDYRIKNYIEKEDFVILLTEMNNFNNWFAVLDEKLPYNGFIHTKDWNYYINCSSTFPIAYEVVALIIRKYVFDNYLEYKNQAHNIPIGCINDMCIQKRDIILKLRTADICPECMNVLKQKLPFSIIKNAIDILEFLRTKMLFSQKFTGLSPLSRLIVNKRKKIYLPDFDNIKIELDALHMTVYMLYLFHPEGIEMSSLCDYKNEMYHIYSHIGKRSDILEMKKSIDSIADITSNSASEKIGKIKRTFINAIGGELAKNYYIKGANGKVKKIDIDRKLVEVAD